MAQARIVESLMESTVRAWRSERAPSSLTIAFGLLAPLLACRSGAVANPPDRADAVASVTASVDTSTPRVGAPGDAHPTRGEELLAYVRAIGPHYERTLAALGRVTTDCESDDSVASAGTNAVRVFVRCLRRDAVDARSHLAALRAIAVPSWLANRHAELVAWSDASIGRVESLASDLERNTVAIDRARRGRPLWVWWAHGAGGRHERLDEWTMASCIGPWSDRMNELSGRLLRCRYGSGWAACGWADTLAVGRGTSNLEIRASEGSALQLPNPPARLPCHTHAECATGWACVRGGCSDPSAI